MNKRAKIIRVFGLLMCCLPFGAAAQSGQLVSSARKIDADKKDTAVEVPRDNRSVAEVAVNPMVLPLFGEKGKTPAHIEWEIRFLNECDQSFANRSEASQFFSSRGWEYLTEGQLDTATHRFNLAWVLNEKNVDTYWGLGVIAYQKGKIPESIHLMKRGLDVADTNAVLMTDLATVQLKLYKENQDKMLLEEAVGLLNRALKYDTTNPNTYMRLSWASFSQGQYEPAWEYVHKARTLELSSVDLAYIQELLAKSPDPKGFFR
ncbi:tetratricopeptide repeat protein [Larkinella soli]|uniref:tetratricopeptide repeat protein n=1 Tax=Larkinella soli TaxID=1770527 RepID=UPI000FFB8561|nr:hypothetical protein [Larkinella soli]